MSHCIPCYHPDISPNLLWAVSLQQTRILSPCFSPGPPEPCLNTTVQKICLNYLSDHILPSSFLSFQWLPISHKSQRPCNNPPGNLIALWSTPSLTWFQPYWPPCCSSSTVGLKFWCVSEWSGELVKIQIAEPHPQSFWFGSFAVGLIICNSNKLLTQLISTPQLRTIELIYQQQSVSGPWHCLRHPYVK